MPSVVVHRHAPLTGNVLQLHWEPEYHAAPHEGAGDQEDEEVAPRKVESTEVVEVANIRKKGTAS